MGIINSTGMKKRARTWFLLHAMLFALLMQQAQPLWAMHYPLKEIPIHGLRDQQYYQDKLQEVKKSTARIQRKVDRIVKEFKKNLERYSQLTKSKGVMVPKSRTGVISKKSQSLSKLTPEKETQSLHDDRLDRALALALDEGLDTITTGKDVSDQLSDYLKYRLEYNENLQPKQLVEELIENRKSGSYDQMMETWTVQLETTKPQSQSKETKPLNPRMQELQKIDSEWQYTSPRDAEFILRLSNATYEKLKTYTSKMGMKDLDKFFNQEGVREEMDQIAQILENEEQQKQSMIVKFQLPSQSLSVGFGLEETKKEWNEFLAAFNQHMAEKSGVKASEEDINQLATFYENKHSVSPEEARKHVLGGGDEYKDEDKIVELTYTDGDGATTHFLACPTVPDGNCFPYAAFTESGDDWLTTVIKATQSRQRLLEAVSNNKNGWATALKPFVAAQCYQLMSSAQEEEVPSSIQEAYKKLQQEVSSTDWVDRFKDYLSEKDVIAYMERFRVGSDDEESYIPIERPEKDYKPTLDPADILALEEKKQIRIFEKKDVTNELNLIKTAGNPNDPLIDLLIKGAIHYERLYTGKSEKEKRDCRQIINNHCQWSWYETFEKYMTF